MTLNDLTPGFKVTTLFDAEYLRNGARYRHSFSGILSTVSFRMTLSDLEWLSKILNGTKHRAASLRQQSYLFHIKRHANIPSGTPPLKSNQIKSNLYCFSSLYSGGVECRCGRQKSRFCMA